MVYIVIALIGFVAGGAFAYVLVAKRRADARRVREAADRLLQEAKVAQDRVVREEKAALDRIVAERANLQLATDQLRKKREELRAQAVTSTALLDKEREEMHARAIASAEALSKEREQLDARAVGLRELGLENRILKRDLLNIATSLRKLQTDRRLQSESQQMLDERSRTLAERYLADVEQWVGRSINANNYAACKQRLLKAIEWVREIGFDVPKEREDNLLERLKADFEQEVRRQIEREEQARIKAQIREEQQQEREVQRELERLERERATLAATLEAALATAQDQHSAQIEDLKARLAEAELKQRAVSQAQLTKAGHIYVISNIGSFGESVFKIGMTRRLEPQERIQELGDASVPFPFDVHMMISCMDAPRLESAIHKEFHKHRLNKVNPRKEYFRVDLDEVRRFVEANHGEVGFTADAEALHYRQSLAMSEEDQEYIEAVFEKAETAIGAPESEE